MSAGALFDVKKVDRRFYERRLRHFLPARMIDIHTHLWHAADFPPVSGPKGESRTVTWPSLVAKENLAAHLAETYRLMFPDKQVTPVVFATLPEGGNLDRTNARVQQEAGARGWPALLFTDPAWDAKELERRLRAGRFLGVKSYLTMAPAYLPVREIRILDYFPPHQLEVLDRLERIVMLHIPRDGRLKDPVNLGQMLEIERAYPRLTLIIAHVGRAYCRCDVGNAFEILAHTRRMLFDFSANTNARVFEQLLRCVGPRRVLFGSDLPITRMRMRRIEKDGRYVNLVPRGLYGDVAGDRNMGEVTGCEADRLTFFLYEEIDAFRRAAERARWSRRDVHAAFDGNARRVLRAAGWRDR